MLRQIVVLVALSLSAFADTPSPAPLPAASVGRPGMVYVASLRNGFTMRFDHRSVMGETSRLYTDARETGYIDIPSEEIASLALERLPVAVAAGKSQAVPPVDLQSVITSASGKTSLDPDLIHSVIRAESGFNPKAISPKGARGLMQLMPDTASKLGVQDSFDAQSNVDGGTRYLRELLARYNGDLAKALAAYNAGPHRVEQYHGVPPYRETRAYVSSIIRDFNRKKLAAQKACSAPSATTAKNTPACPASAKAPAKKPPSTSAAAKSSSSPVPGS
jgi:Transglycosylase SLT domain